MADDLPDGFDSLDDLQTAFVFVPHGDPEPPEWLAAHPGWARFPAMMVPRGSPQPGPPPSPPVPADDPDRRRPGVMWAFARRPVAPDPSPADPYDPKSPAFDPVRTLQRIGYLPQDLTAPPGPPPTNAGAVRRAHWLEPLIETPLAKPPEGVFPRYMERIPGQTGKEGATDTPSWAKGQPRRVGEDPETYARRVMDERRGRRRPTGAVAGTVV